MKINVRSFSISLAATAFVLIFILGIWFSATGFGKTLIDLLTSLYAGILRFTYNPVVSLWSNLSANFLNTILLSVFTAIDGAVLGFVLASFYNLLNPKEK
jgi:hypothetical protein